MMRLRRRVGISMVLLLSLALLSGAARAGDRGARKAETREIQQLDEQWRTALVAADTGTLEHLLAEDFLGITSNGKLWTKQEFIRRIESHQQTFQHLEMLDNKIRVAHGSAVVIARAHVQEVSEGKVVDGYFRYTVVYGRRQGGAWKMLNFEATRVSGPTDDEPAPGKSPNGPQAPSAQP